MDSVMVQRIWWCARGFMDPFYCGFLYLYKYIQFIIYPETLKFYASVIGVRSRSCKVGFIKRRLWKFLRILWKGLCCIEKWNVEMLFSSYNNFLFVILYLYVVMHLKFILIKFHSNVESKLERKTKEKPE